MQRNRKSSSGLREGSGRRMKEVACPTCTVHLQIALLLPMLSSSIKQLGSGSILRIRDHRVRGLPEPFPSEYLGIKSVVPAYMDPKLQPDDLLTGVCFASGGSGYIPMTPTYLNVIPMLHQLTYFQHYIARVKKLVGQEKGDQIITNGLAIVFAGSNDMGITYYGPGAQWVKDDIYSFTSNMVESATSFAMQLYGYGARHIGVAGMTPLGCIPAQRTLKGGPHRKCAQDVNYAVQIFNTKLSIALDHLAKTLPDSKLVFMDIYSPFSQILENPADYEDVVEPD
ncbi:hypothetical protein F2Q68_00040921 [Brassica cretica]|uniref:GDSL esterase/lipase n=1 Tax=Brassica cretica TaxID=69181 RepID=A0A8S9MII2_BRACR|nr:hypothetical protein F2Q68_00040921 [Brassica cretica]